MSSISFFPLIWWTIFDDNLYSKVQARRSCFLYFKSSNYGADIGLGIEIQPTGFCSCCYKRIKCTKDLCTMDTQVSYSCPRLTCHNSFLSASIARFIRPVARVGSGDPVRVLHLYTTNTLDEVCSIYCWDICTTCRYQSMCYSTGASGPTALSVCSQLWLVANCYSSSLTLLSYCTVRCLL